MCIIVLFVYEQASLLTKKILHFSLFFVHSKVSTWQCLRSITNPSNISFVRSIKLFHLSAIIDKMGNLFTSPIVQAVALQCIFACAASNFLSEPISSTCHSDLDCINGVHCINSVCVRADKLILRRLHLGVPAAAALEMGAQEDESSNGIPDYSDGYEGFDVGGTAGGSTPDFGDDPQESEEEQEAFPPQQSAAPQQPAEPQQPVDGETAAAQAAAAAAKAAAEKATAAAEKAAAEKAAAAEKIAAEKAVAEKAAAEKAAAQKAAAEKRAEDKMAAIKAVAQKGAAQQQAAEKAAERIADEKAAAEQAADEKAEAARAAAEKAAEENIAAARAAAEKAAAEQFAAARAAAASSAAAPEAGGSRNNV